jgi:hypothetical protein
MRGCTVKTVHGHACRRKPVPGRTWCVWHDPARADANRAMTRKGAAARGRQLAFRTIPRDSPLRTPARTPEEVREHLALVASYAATGTISTSIAAVMTAALKALGDLLDRRRESGVPGAEGAWAVVYEEPVVEAPALPAKGDQN